MFRKLMSGMAPAVAVGLCLGCPQQTAETPSKPDAVTPEQKPPASSRKAAAASQPGMPGQAASAEEQVDRAFLPPRPANDGQYARDPEIFPKRLGIHRIFLQADKISHLRDPVFIPGTSDVLVMAKVGGLQSLWRLPSDGSTAARMVFARPLYTPGEKPDAVNRGSWYVGTPSVFPDGKHAMFCGSKFGPRGSYRNVMGIAPIAGATGAVAAVTVEDVAFARTPHIHPDGKTVVFAACTQVRKLTLNGTKTQTVTSELVADLKRLDTNAKGVCTVNRPRFSPDGSKIIFVVNGQFLHEDLKKQYAVPVPLNEGDYLIEPWITNADGTNTRRLIKDDTYERDLRGRLKTGGSNDPNWFPDGKKVIFAHGRQMAAVNVDGTRGKLLSVPVVASNRAVKFIEGDPVVSSDGRLAAFASDIVGTESNPRPAPAGVSILDLTKIDLSALDQ